MADHRTWNPDELEFIRQNYTKIPAAAIARQLCRSPSSVKNKAHKLGLRLPLNPKAHWDAEQDQILISGWGDGGNAAIAAIARRVGRTTKAVRSRAYALGLNPKTQQRRWEPEEIELLSELAGEVQITELLRQHRELCDRRGWPRRSRTALQVFINKRLGASWRLEGDSFSANAIADGLNCNNHRVLKWIEDKEFAKVLKPSRFSDQDKSRWLIKRKNLAKFLAQYPAELERCRPNLTWLVSLFDV